MATLSQAEVRDFWALGIPPEAQWLPDDEWLEALVSSRVQVSFSDSSMGSAETGWKRTQRLEVPRTLCAVVRPGRLAEDWPWEQLRDDRDEVGICWVPFWRTQASIARAHVTAPYQTTFFAECRRWLTQLGDGAGAAEAFGADVSTAWARVMRAAAGPATGHWGHGDLARQGAMRMELLRFVVRLVRKAP